MPSLIGRPRKGATGEQRGTSEDGSRPGNQAPHWGDVHPVRGDCVGDRGLLAPFGPHWRTAMVRGRCGAPGVAGIGGRRGWGNTDPEAMAAPPCWRLGAVLVGVHSPSGVGDTHPGIGAILRRLPADLPLRSRRWNGLLGDFVVRDGTGCTAHAWAV